MQLDTRTVAPPFLVRAACYLLLSGVVLFGAPAAVAQADTLWAEDWEGDFTDNWFVDAGTWEAGMPTSGPAGAHGGENVAATVLDGNYGGNVSSRLVRFMPFVVPSADEFPRLRFWHWYSFSSGDDGEVQVSTDGGGTWETVSSTYTATGSGVWTHPLIDLSAYAGEAVLLAFSFRSNGSGFSTGWYLDDLAVLTGALHHENPEGFESGIGDWHVEFGTWEVGVPSSGPGSANTGVQTAATVLGGNYGGNVNSRLISPPFVVPPADGSPRLRFWHWYSFSSGDDGEVQVRVCGEEDWQTVAGPFTGTSSGVWTFFNVALATYAGEAIQLAFDFHSNGSGFSTGWYVDDIEIEALAVSTEPRGPTGSFVLRGTYPNPSASAPTVAFVLSEPAGVTLRVFDVLGREVATVSERLAAGEHRMPWQAVGLPGGVYLYRVEARMPGGTEVRSGRLTLLR